MVNKSRNIPLTELYKNLQIEFLSYFMRAKTYRKDYAEYVDNYKRICLQKREKVENISRRNSIPSIFNDSKMKEKYIKEFLGENGVPNYSYRDDAIRNRMQKWDKFYFFMKGTSVSIKQDGDIDFGVVVSNNKKTSVVTVRGENNEVRDLHYNNLSRLFPEDFFDF